MSVTAQQMYGKWSVLDGYVMMLMMCAFKFDLQVAPELEVVSYVVPHWGFYSFLLATTLSLLLGHSMMASHRHATDDFHDIDSESTEAVRSLESLITHEYIISSSIAKRALNWPSQVKRKSSPALPIDVSYIATLGCQTHDLCRDSHRSHLVHLHSFRPCRSLYLDFRFQVRRSDWLPSQGRSHSYLQSCFCWKSLCLWSGHRCQSSCSRCVY